MTGVVLALALGAVSPEETRPGLSTLLVVLLLVSYAGMGLVMGLHVRQGWRFRIPNDSLFWWAAEFVMAGSVGGRWGQIPFHVMPRGEGENSCCCS